MLTDAAAGQPEPNESNFSCNAQSNQDFRESARLGSDFLQPKAGLTQSKKDLFAFIQANRPFFALNSLSHKCPKDTQPQDKIMRSEGLGIFPTSSNVFDPERRADRVCAARRKDYKNCWIVDSSTAASIGLAMCPFMPAAMERSRSSANALAVIATMGMPARSGSASDRILFVAS